MNVVIYARFSSSGQREESIEGQVRVCEQYAQQNGYTVIAIYCDRALSGKNDDRPEFQKLIADSAKKYFQAVLVYSVDRFGRNLHQSIDNEYKLQKNDVALISATENFADNPAGRMHRNIMMTFAQYYSDELAQKVKRGMNINAEKCLSNGGVIPLGFKIVDKRLQINEDTAPIVQKVFELYASGYRIIDITNYLNTQQIKTMNNKIFNKNSLNTMLKNKKYIGIYKYGDIEIPNGVPRIISDELFFRVADIMEKNKKAPARARAKEEYLLTTKLFCGNCKSLMVGMSGKSSTGKVYNYYSCNNARQKLCIKKNIQKKYLEDLIVNECRKLLTNKNIQKIANEVIALYEREKDKSNLKRLNKLLKENDKITENLINAMEQGQNIDIINERITQKRKEREEIEKEITLEQMQHVNLTVPQIKFFLTQLKKGDIDDLKYRKTLINVFINAIYLYDDKITLLLNSDKVPVTIDSILLNNIEKDNEQVKSLYINEVGSPIK